jgi:hypothetical protein
MRIKSLPAPWYLKKGMLVIIGCKDGSCLFVA